MLILKSASPRRKEILSSLGLFFEVIPESVDESLVQAEKPLEYLKRITLLKLGKIPPNSILISCDTIVVKANKLYPKPESKEQAVQFISELLGDSHSVYTGIAIASTDFIHFAYDETKVFFKDWSVSEIHDYVMKMNPMDKAGAYGIQDRITPVQKFQGSYSNVVGFPLQIFFQYHYLWSKYLKNYS
ncbi:MAG: nucleoside triphosphate pyrophosphatase [Leptospiraceae bacterium]|nr:nucleoside triphosphate pyrophosphatase [Leptospiraceae bacterium]